MKRLYCFSLSKQTSKIMEKLKGADMKYEIWSYNIDYFLDLLVSEQPEFILGLGTYFGTGQKNIRIETVTKNQFRNITIDDNLPISKQIPIRPFVKQFPKTILTSAMGNSWCNLMSYKIMRLIETKKLKSEYTFLHIPKVFKRKNASEIINDMVSSIGNL